MTFPDLLRAIYAHDQVRYLLLLVAGNLVLGVAASLKTGDFALTLLADWLTKRVLPLMAGYGAAALLALARPSEFGLVRDAAFATLALALVGYVLANLRDVGIPVPDALSRPRPDVLAASRPPQPVVIVPAAAAAADRATA
jgi:hypothetical protein